MSICFETVICPPKEPDSPSVSSQDLFAALDTDADGNVQEREFVAFYRSKIQPMADQAKHTEAVKGTV